MTGRYWRSCLLIWAAAAVQTACAGTAGGAAGSPLPAPLLGPATPVRAGADTLTLLRSGPATFTQLRAVIDAARLSVEVEVYELGKPQLTDALVAAHSRGVTVTVVDDPSEQHSAGTAVRLRAAGIGVIDYPVRRLMIDHVKLLIADHAVAVVGGINWGVKSPRNHDYDVMIRGPAVTSLERVFARDLATCGRSAVLPDVVADPAVIVASTLPGIEIRPLVIGLIDAARRSLDVELFVLTDTGAVRAIEAAHARGVAVRVLLDPSQRPSDPSFAALRDAGIAVRLYRSRGERLHAKAAVADATTVLFGSANWSGGGFARNHELDVEVPRAPALAAQMLDQMRLDWDASA
ncbi:MAG: phosphatidylserine/phosphatidylglycerophosphate/cardiolipin synthase family protein [Chloroflexi bacterium]|nr:MAG: phosphatidylserine/phosphatidylglycerophosphate/cardiolipin synthase family protein [Chloroflexota bacterium]